MSNKKVISKKNLPTRDPISMTIYIFNGLGLLGSSRMVVWCCYIYSCHGNDGMGYKYL